MGSRERNEEAKSCPTVIPKSRLLTSLGGLAVRILSLGLQFYNVHPRSKRRKLHNKTTRFKGEYCEYELRKMVER